jgi:hypothetical protein
MRTIQREPGAEVIKCRFIAERGQRQQDDKQRQGQ